MKKYILLLLLPLFASCEKMMMDDNPADNPQENFDILWNTINEKYSFLGLKNINWDSIRNHYGPMVTDDISNTDLFTIMDSMLYDLEDGHVNLVSPFNLSRNWNWYLGFPDNFDYEVLERNYLKDDYRIAGGLKYTIIDSIGYIYYESFSSGFSVENLNAAINYMKGTKGLIFDVRNNGGGVLNNAFILAQSLIDAEKQVLITSEKMGPGRDDFGNSLSYTLRPATSYAHYDGEVAVLINRRCYSATNTFAAILYPFDNITLIGDQTGGGGGIPVDSELPNGWTYRFSATRSLIPIDANSYYDIEMGIPPDVVAHNTEARMAEGKDDILETALRVLE
ncbi:S41 family peptidase [Owenweeksia hongkongensis]|uniref:S41 family peptidase n=1 Tax=Owenweeksia hongkongensis TaxID=253245 RepID=UPI003A950B87